MRFWMQAVVVEWFDTVYTIWRIILQEYIGLNDGSVGVLFWRTYSEATGFASLRWNVEHTEADYMECELP